MANKRHTVFYWLYVLKTDMQSRFEEIIMSMSILKTKLLSVPIVGNHEDYKARVYSEKANLLRNQKTII